MSYCKWCTTQTVSMWNPDKFCSVCRELKNEVIANLKLAQLTEIATIAKRRMVIDGRSLDFVPGIQARVTKPGKYEGVERRKTQGTLFDRRGYL